MGDGTPEKPLTREDVLRLIEENGGTAAGLDLSDKVFESGIDLRGLNLKGIFLVSAHLERAQLWGAHLEETLLAYVHLEGASLLDAHLEGASLVDAHLEGADLGLAHLEGADLGFAHLEGASLFDAEFSPDTKLQDVDWGNYILAEEKDREKEGKRHLFKWAEDTYRRLKTWYTNAGLYNISGEFFYREMEAKRKAMQWWPNPLPRAWSKLLSILCGYGEKPLRVVRWGALVLFGLALLYFFLCGVAPYTLTVQSFLNSLYYSTVSFTALGYGPWFTASSVRGWTQGVGAAEAIIGVFMMALFLITFVRKMTR